MCEPVTIGALTITAGQMAAGAAALSAGAALYGQSQSAKATNAANENQRVAVHAAAIENYAQANREGIEDRENQTVQLSSIDREQVSRLATARVSAGAAGIGGASVDALMLDLAGKGLEASTTSEMNYARQSAARQDQLAGIGTNQRSQLAGIRDVRGPGALEYLGAGLQVGNSYATTTAKTKQRIGA